MTESCSIPEFVLPEDGWFNIATRGEWPHRPTGLVQVLDDEAIAAIIDAFKKFTAEPNWPGVLIDFDHQSLDQDKPTVAAGWIIALEDRPNGLWAKVRWSDIGRKSIEGGRYRFISPVWRSTDCVRLAGDRIRPLKLMNCAVTNDPNIKGLFPLSNAEGAPVEFSPPPVPINATVQECVQAPSVDSVQNDGPFSSDQATIPTKSILPEEAPASIEPVGRETIDARELGRGALGRVQLAFHFATAFRNRRVELDVLRNYRSPTTGEEWIGGAPWGRSGGGGGGGGAGGGGNSGWDGPQTTRDHESRISSLDRQIEELEASREPRPVRGDYGMRDWRETRDRMMREGASPTDILKTIAADKAHNKQVREQVAKIKRDLKKVYKDPAARERAYQRRMDHETRMHEKDVRDWEKNEDRITREVRKLEGRKDEEVAKSVDSELKAQVKEADRELKISMQNQKLLARAALEAEKTARQREVLAAREQRRIDEANERDRRAAQTQEERARREALRMDPVKLERYEQQRVKSYWSAVQRGDWQSAQRLYPDANHSSVRSEVDAIRQAASADRGRAALLLRDLTSTAPAGAYPSSMG